MKTAILSQHRQQLLKRLTELETAVANIKTKIVETAETQTSILQDCLDHAREQIDLHGHIKMIHKYFSERRQILIALNRIEEGTFGECVECGDAIGEKRLLVQPSASSCLECQHLKEDCTGLAIDSVKKLIPRKLLTNFIFSVEAA